MAKYSGSADNGEFDRALQYALLQLGTPSITPKPEQRKAIHSIYRGRDVFVWLPTGFGKSLCYEVLPFVMDHKLSRIDAKSSLVLVVSPLIALMTDQVCSILHTPRVVYGLAYIVVWDPYCTSFPNS